jgi:DNA replication protein DnaD
MYFKACIKSFQISKEVITHDLDQTEPQGKKTLDYIKLNIPSSS